jgi:Abnormal spindle-like microcephaly-assoc'd, ASPM-SPD-2-Hydin
MAIDGARKKSVSLTSMGRGHSSAFIGRAALLGIALSAWVFAAGCVGLTGNPNATTTGGSSGSGTGSGGGTSSGGSQSSQLSPSSAQVTFGNVTVGSSTSQLVTLTAAGTADVKISSVTASGAGFSASGGSNVTLTPNQSVTISVAFQPGAAGTATGKLTISSDATNSSLAIALSGDGVAASTNHSVALKWQPSSTPVIGYFVFRGSSASNLAQLNVNEVATTSYTDTGVVNGQTYVYAVKSINASSLLSGFSNTVTVTVPAQ